MAPALPKSIWPAYFDFSAPITLPMSLMLDAPDVGDRIGDRFLHLSVGELLRQVLADDDDLFGFLLGELGATGLGVDLLPTLRAA